MNKYSNWVDVPYTHLLDYIGCRLECMHAYSVLVAKYMQIQ